MTGPHSRTLICYDEVNNLFQIHIEKGCWWVFKSMGGMAWLGIASGKVQSRTYANELKRLKEKYKLKEEPQ